jgi:ribosomal protein S12 methylthiotransferase accessory factor YcaO
MPAAVSEAVERYSAYLGDDVVEFPLAGLDHLGVPVWSAAVFEGTAQRTGTGYGEDDEAARASALGELVEETCASRLPPARMATFAQLGDAAADPRTLCLPAGSAYADDLERAWVPARRWPGGDEILVPLELAASAPGDLPAGYAPLTTPITNGLGAGLTLEAAVDHALRELVQRDGNSVAYRALDRGVVVADAPGPWTVKAALSDLGMANVYVVGDDPDPPHPLSVTACGEAAHPDRDAAVRKATLEFCSSRVRKLLTHAPLAELEGAVPAAYLERAACIDPAGEEPRALDAMLDWLRRDVDELRALMADRVWAQHERVALADLPHAPAATASGLLAERGFEILVLDLSPPDGAVHVAKAIVPGLEVETMSYGRCGTRNLARLLERDLGLVGLGAPPPGARLLALPDGHEPAWLDPAAVDRVVGLLYPLYREPARHAAAGALAARP